MNRVDAFDPDAIAQKITRPPAQVLPMPAVNEMPIEWRRGIEILNAMAVPRGATPERWAQIVQDATRFAWWGHERAISAGWTIGSLFGFELREPSGFVSLVIAIRGGRVTDINERRARIVDRPDRPGWVTFHHRQMPDRAPPLWAYKGEKR